MSLPVLVNHFRLPICYYFGHFLYINNQIQWHKHLPFIFVFVYSVSVSLSLSLLCALLTKNTTQMKRSPAPSCSSSSSSSCVGSVIPHQSEKPKAKAKRAKKNHNPEKCQNGNSSAGSARRSSIYRGVTRWSFSHFSLFNVFPQWVFICMYHIPLFASKTQAQMDWEIWSSPLGQEFLE